ncbi:MAG: pentapeptide repeat-containing protein [Desulfomonilaceae bacterium]|nr:pentapeptide repeat-containing protein [Desulfomonilaceae bacterium]
MLSFRWRFEVDDKAELLEILKQGADAWNAWREENPDKYVDLSGVDLSRAKFGGVDWKWLDLSRADLRDAILSFSKIVKTSLHRADLSNAVLTSAVLEETDFIEARLRMASLVGAKLRVVDFSGADLRGAKLMWAHFRFVDFSGADLTEANLQEADLHGVDLSKANLTRANLRGANLRGADLTCATLVEANLEGADLTGTQVYGASIWKVALEGAMQRDIVITDDGEPKITVDNLEVAQFIHLLLTNEKIRDVIDTIAKKVVLILGRFADERKVVLDRLREELRHRDFSPVVFDFEKPDSRDFTETVRTLAHLSRFVIADLTEAKSVPQELQATVPDLAIPFLPIVDHEHGPWSMFQDFYKYAWVLKEYRYESLDTLVAELDGTLIPKVLELEKQIPRLRQREDWSTATKCATTDDDE